MTYASTDASHDRRRLTGVKHCDHQMPVPQEHDGSASTARLARYDMCISTLQVKPLRFGSVVLP